MAAKKSNPALELAEKLLRTLEAQRSLGGDAYPLTLQRLGELTDAGAPPDLLLKAAASKPFKERVLAAQPKNLAAPLARREDVDQLAASAKLLEFTLEAQCSPEKPAWPPNRLKVDRALRKPFDEALARRLRDNDWPVTVGCQLVKNKPLLYLKRLPPPPPPKKPEVALAEELVHVLEAQRDLGEGAYPLTIQRLARLSAAGVDEKLLKKALGLEPFKSHALLGLAGKAKPNLDNPVALASDREQLASSRLLLELALRAARGDASNAVVVADLPKKVAPVLQQPFTAALARQIEARALPPSVGWMWIARKQQLFFVEDVHHTAAVVAAAPPAARLTESAFAHAFDDAFQRLNREAGSHNLVSLVPLRRAVAAAREVFDAELRRLRLAGRYTLSPAEGRHGIKPEEQEAGIVENGQLLLYVSRKSP